MRSRVIALLAVPLIVAGCSTEDEPAAAESAVTARPDETYFDVKWKDSTVVISEDVATSAWLREDSSPEAGRYAFERVPALDAVAKGSIVLLPKVGLYTVTAVEKKTDRLILTTEPASLLDAATEGEMRWNIDTSAHEAVALSARGKQGGAVTRALAPLTKNRPVVGDASIDMELAGEIGGSDYTMTVKMSRSTADGRTALDFDIAGGIEEGYGGREISALGTFKGRVAFRSDGVYAFKDGQTKKFDFRVADVDLDATTTFDVKGMTVEGELVDYPARIIAPFLVGPIPMYVAFGAAVKIEADIRVNETIHAEGNIKYKGDVAISGSGLAVTKVDATGTPEFTGKAELDVGFAAGIEAVAAGPRIELGMGVPQLGKLGASAGVYADLRGSVGAFASASVSSGGKPCFEGVAGLGVFYGGEAKIFGLKIGAEKPILERKRRFYEDGSCPPLD